MGGTALLIFLLLNALAVGIITTMAVIHWRAHKNKPSNRPKGGVQPILTFDMRQRIIRETEEAYENAITTSANELKRNLHASTTELHKQANELGRRIISNELRRYQDELAALRDENATTLKRATDDIATHRADLRKKLDDRQAAVEEKLSSEQAALEEKFTQHSNEIDAIFQKRQAEYIAWQEKLAALVGEQEQKYAQRQAELTKELEASIDEKRQKMVADLETKFDDVIIAFITDALGSNVDLGAQLPYLTTTLAEHKDELVKELS